jgi:hypothetical protein
MRAAIVRDVWHAARASPSAQAPIWSSTSAPYAAFMCQASRVP